MQQASLATPSAGRSGSQPLSGRAANLKTCGHFNCALSLPICCGCSDLRPQHYNHYQVYVDGQGMVEGERWSFYCVACKERLCEDKPSVRQSMAQNTDNDNNETQHTRRRARVLANYQRVFGTRDEIDDAEYESPLTSMFTRAWSRYREHQDEMHVLTPSHEEQTEFPEVQILTDELERLDFSMVRGRSLETANLQPAFSREHSPAPLPNVDLSACFNVARPPPCPPIALLNVECKICFSQVADVLLLPCAHLMLCSYCAPIIKLDGPKEQRRDKCPMCRAKVNRQIKIYR